MTGLPVRVGVLRALLKEIAVSGESDKPLVIGGAHELARALERALLGGGDPAAVRVGDPEGAAVYVHVVARAADDEDERALKRGRRARTPIVAVVTGPATGELSLPHVLATDVIRVGAGEGFPLDRIARAIAGRLGEDAAPLAARIPSLRPAVCDHLIYSFARRNGIVGLAVFIPGADLPLLALNELRLVLRLEQAYGLTIDPRERLPEIAATLGVGFGLRAIARELLDLVPAAGWVVKGAVAYAGTRALGEATLRRIDAATPRRGEASRAVP